jgi:hypothetical protein
MSSWPAWDIAGKLEEFSCGNRMFVKYWKNIFCRTYRGEIDTWDLQWLFTMWNLGALAILPAHNLTQNIGFGQEGTHTLYDTPKYVKESLTCELSFPLNHPPEIRRAVEADSIITSRVVGINWSNAIKNHVRRLPGLSMLANIKRSLLRNK